MRETCLVCCRPISAVEEYDRGGPLCTDPYDGEGEHSIPGLRAMSVVLGTIALVRWALEAAPLCELCGKRASLPGTGICARPCGELLENE